ncbi:hypothetical protein EUX98_g7435 [Antrodiella citrinella]|uniref:Uncharacterized protein n=1 Tax=Antrodiella citrinella TaxID=2447956 RepID=A0A4S4MLH7_9APHY|nr:hypothetical protein EUX98_g7435 [Antrodiella citrinella]
MQASFAAATPLYHIYTPGYIHRETTFISHISPDVANDPSYNFKGGFLWAYVQVS